MNIIIFFNVSTGNLQNNKQHFVESFEFGALLFSISKELN